MNIEKSFKCHFCKKLNHDLTQLPFNRLICEICIEYKCLNEFKGDDEPNEDLDKINAVGLFMDKIDKHYGKLRIINSKSSNNIGAKLYKIKNRVQDFKDYINNYEKRINSKLGILRFELDWNYKNIQGIIEKKKLNLLNRVNLMENDIMENLKANRQNIRKAIDLFVEKNTAWILGQKDNSEINGQIERKNFESIFSMDSILNIKNHLNLGELCNEIKLDYEVFSINTNGSSIFVCHENPIKLESCEYLRDSNTYQCINKIYVKQKSLFGSQINILNAIDGSFLKSVYLPYNFLHFYVTDFEQKFPKNYPEIVEEYIN
ncbi:hypothetical protein BpHYR1_001608 [Brachionus plicatilis]|uniref:Uncharacterized protein n=1 Tax=Brachionus plicatilis TaxID=10195 RepID=A0A3M7QA16_BRAPC|nr:hypothetical protein BpHYR1_001608 [Brachionus plicatilis]